jgi:ABC-type lipoprotein export system ATPase subunit
VGLVATARGFVKVYGEGRAAPRILDRLDLDVEAGELAAVTGRSGSGKSTLLNIIGGLDRVDAGSRAASASRRGGSRDASPPRDDRTHRSRAPRSARASQPSAGVSRQ